MVLKLHGFFMSTCTRRVAMVLHEKNVPFEFVPVDITKGEQKKPEYLEKHPFGVVPYLDDDGFILYESRAICQYIAIKYANQGTPLIPTDPKEYALYLQAASTELTHFNDLAERAVIEKVFKPMRGAATDMAVYEGLLKSLDSKLDVYDKILSKQKYLAGNEVTLADLYHIPFGVMLGMGGSDIMTSKPNVKRWFEAICARPAWQAVKDGVKSTA
ncbi:glutathione S-transferase [Pholiota conissans]|uniref:glutathione transferase n=1 Tax=Pholiota conissans TaxID=109636 RepID=A0A9P5YUQ6_9AGAR|nr:glutathione S-transferase [Pholiota conissans]